MKIFILRHGESVANFEKRLPTKDTPLTETGVQQATAAAAYLSGNWIQLIYASPATRAFQTAKIVSERLSLQIMVRPEVKDMSFGAFGGRKEDGSDKDVNELLKERNKDRLGHRFPEGENFYDIQKRVLPLIKEIISSQKQAVAVVGHLYPNRIIVSELVGVSLEECLRIKQPNDLIYVVDTQTRSVRHWHAGQEKDGLLLREASKLGPE